jgi:hypothetical protein
MTGLRELLHRELVEQDEPTTSALIKELRHIKRQKEFSRAEFLKMTRWKSPRSIRQCERNSPNAIRRVSRAVFRTRSERERLELLTQLHGVGIPTASAILTLCDPKRYGVIDIRVWQMLHTVGAVKNNPSGIGFAFNDWFHYLKKLRYHAQELRTSARLVEWTVFLAHKKFQNGTLYRKRRKPGQ